MSKFDDYRKSLYQRIDDAYEHCGKNTDWGNVCQSVCFMYQYGIIAIR